MAFPNTNISFGQVALTGEESVNPTALDFSKTGNPVLFVAQQNGLIWRYEVERQPDGPDGDTNDEFIVTQATVIDIVKFNTQNYNDDGVINGTTNRQVTGMAVTTDAQGNDVLYVSSSDWRIAVGNDTGLDTNSGQIHKIVLGPNLVDQGDNDPTVEIQSNVAILRGLPRSEENHATNGLDLYEDPDTGVRQLWIAQGGNTNKGAPGNNFSGTVDFTYSGTVLKVDLAALESYDVRTDGAGNDFILDLPTLDDPTRDNLDLGSLGISGAPANFTLDDNGTGSNNELYPDWAGGNNGLNMVKIADQVLVQDDGALQFVENPLQIHAPGYRNNYDVLVTEKGEVYSWDNGPNTNWGGSPLSFSDGQIVDDWTSEFATTEFNETGDQGYGDQLHYAGNVTDDFGPYAGDANPIRASVEALAAAFDTDGSYKGASPSDPILDQDGSTVLFANEDEARAYLASILIIYEETSNGVWEDVTDQTGLPVDLYDIVSGYNWEHPGASLSNPQSWYDTPSLMDGTAYSIESELFNNNQDGSLNTENTSTNGLGEYTAGTFFGGALKGAIIGAGFNEDLFFRLPVDNDGDGRTDAVTEVGEIDVQGSNPLGVATLGDNGLGPFIDNTEDGFNDFAGLVVSANHGDDNILFFIPGGTPTTPETDLDLDGIDNTNDTHVGDPSNGKGVIVQPDAAEPTLWHFELNNPDTTPDGAVPPSGVNSIAGDVGINAVWRNGVLPQVDNEGDRTQGLYNALNLDLAGASTFISVVAAHDGTAEGPDNTQQDVVGIGFVTPQTTGSLSIVTTMMNFLNAGTNSDKTWNGGEKAGLVVGPGDQDTFAQAAVVVVDDGGTIKYGIELLVEEDNANTSVFLEVPGIESAIIAGVGGKSDMEVAMDVDLTPGSESAVARVRYVDDGTYTDWFETGSLALPEAVVDALKGQYNNFGQQTGAFVGLLATTSTGDDSFLSEWDKFEVTATPREAIDGEVLYRWNADNDSNVPSAVADWIAGATFGDDATIVGGHSFASNNADQNGLDPSVQLIAPDTPTQVYDQEMWGNSSGNPMGLEFGGGGLADGTYAVRLFMGNGFNGTSEPGERVFNIDIEGADFLDGVDLSATFGHKVGGAYEWIGQVSDGTVDIDFEHVVENPLINAVEIIKVADPFDGPAISVADGTVAEDAGSIAISVSADPAVPSGDDDVTVVIEVAPVTGEATPGVDYEVTGSNVTESGGVYTITGDIAAGSADFTFPVTILDDTAFEGDEAFEVRIASVSGADAGIGDGTATVTITEDDAQPSGSVLYRVNAGGPELAADDGSSLPWSADTGQFGDAGNSPYLVANSTGNTTFNSSGSNGVPVTTKDPGAAASAPVDLFNTERYDPGTVPEMLWEFPVADGEFVVNLFFAEIFNGVDAAGERVFDVSVEGSVPAVFDGIDPYAGAGGYGTGFMLSHTVDVTDGNLSLEFLHDVENPAIKGIEILTAGEPPLPPDAVNAAAVAGGDFSGAFDAPSQVTLAAGSNVIRATQQGESEPGGRDYDYVTITVPVGHQLTGVVLDGFDDYDGDPAIASNAAFVGMQAGSAFSADAPQDASVLMGAHVYDEAQVGDDLLPELADGSVFNPNSGATLDTAGAFTTPVGPGDYTFWWSQNGAATTSELNFVVEEIPSNGGEVVAAINAGGPALTQDGIDFAADDFFNGGSTFEDDNSGNGQQPVFDGTVYETERYGDFSYAITVEAGLYNVDLHFAEIFQGPGVNGSTDGIGERIFDVTIEGTIVLDDFDILAETGGDINQALVKTFEDIDPTASGASDAIDIQFTTVEDNAKVSGIVVREAAAEPTPGSALVEVTPGSGLGASTFSGSSFQITNTGEAQITQVSFDLSTGILPDMVFDPVGSGGDATSSCLTPNSGAAATGFVAPSDPCVDPYSQPRQGGFDLLTVNFTEFDQGEEFFFTTDVDPNSIQGVPGAGNAGAVSGYELTGATVTITYANGATDTVSLYEDGSLGGAQAISDTSTALTAPTIELVGAGDAVPDGIDGGDRHQATVGSLNQSVKITGTPNAQFSLLQMDSRLYIASGDDPFNVDPDELPFYPNEAMSGKALYSGQLDANGEATVPVTLIETAGSNDTPDGGLNHFIAVLSDALYAVDQEVSQTSNVVVVEYDPTAANTDPVANDDAVGTDEETAFSGNVLDDNGNGADSDADLGDTLTVTEVNGNASDVGQQITLASGALLTLNADGTFSYDPNGAFDDLNAGETDTDSFAYTISDGNGGSDTATVTVTIDGADDPTGTTVLFRVNAGGPLVAAIDGGPDWMADTSGSPSQYLPNAGSNNTSSFSAVDPGPTVPSTTPGEIFDTERWDNTTDAAGEMAWAFPIAEDGTYEVRLYMGNGWSGSNDPGERVFDVSIEGSVPANLDDIDLSGQFGHQVGAMISNTVEVTDGTLDIEFIHGSANNPLVNGIEIIKLETTTATLISVNDPTVVESGDTRETTLAFTLTASEPIDGDVDVSFTASGPFASAPDSPATVTFVDGTATLEVTVANDDESNGPEEVTLTLTDAVPSNGSSVGDVAVDTGDAVGTGTVTEDDVTFSYGASVVVNKDTTFGSDPIEITNTSDPGVKITNVEFDIATAILSLGLDLGGEFLGAVFDPTGTAGDVGGQGLIVNSNPGNVVGFVDQSGTVVSPGTAITTSPYPFSGQLTGGDGEPGGFRFMELDFNDFDTDELFKFGVDVDPQSIQNASGTGQAGAVSGGEMAGTTVTITFEGPNGEIFTETQELLVTGLNSSEALFNGTAPSQAPILEILGEVEGGDPRRAETTANEHQVKVSGVTPNATVQLAVIDASGYEKNGGNGSEIVPEDPFHANQFDAAPEILTAPADANGVAMFDVTLDNDVGDPPATVDNLFFFSAVELDANGDPVSALSQAAELKVGPITNEEPVAVDDVFQTDEDVPLNGNVLADNGNGVDSDGDNDALQAILVSGVSNGALTLNTDGSFSYTPAADFVGTDSFTYQANDGTANSNEATVTITVDPVNDAPTLVLGDDLAVPQNAGSQVIEGFAVIGPGGGDDEASQIVFTAVTTVSDPSLFSVQPFIGVNGQLAFEPALNATGTATIIVQATDDGGTANGGVDTAEATFDITIGTDPFQLYEDENLASAINAFASFEAAANAAEPGNAILVEGPEFLGNIGLQRVRTDDITVIANEPFSALLKLAGPTITLTLGGDADIDVNGNPQANTLTGNDGDNELNGQTGNDLLFGLDGDDLLRGRSGTDEIHGGEGEDVLRGDGDDDLLFGDAGNDVIVGGGGNDEAQGGAGDDLLRGLNGNDMLFGNEGEDRIRGDDGDDTLDGGAETDRLFGGTGNDEIFGGDGRDIVRGDAGDDTLDGGADRDGYVGGAGNDTFILNFSEINNDSIRDWTIGEDIIVKFDGTETGSESIEERRPGLFFVSDGTTTERFTTPDSVNTSDIDFMFG